MAATVSIIDSENIQVITSQVQNYNINDLVTQANNITQNMIDLHNNLKNVNDLISQAQNSGIIIDPSIIVDQSSISTSPLKISSQPITG